MDNSRILSRPLKQKWTNSHIQIHGEAEGLADMKIFGRAAANVNGVLLGVDDGFGPADGATVGASVILGTNKGGCDRPSGVVGLADTTVLMRDGA
jgi:hypothetical protein